MKSVILKRNKYDLILFQQDKADAKDKVELIYLCSSRDSPPDGDSHCFQGAGTWADHLRSQPTCLKHIEEGVAGGYGPYSNPHAVSLTLYTTKQL